MRGRIAASLHLPFRLIKRIPKPVRRHVPAPSCRYRKNKWNNSGFTVLTVHTEAIWPFKMRNRPFNWYRNNKRLMPDRLTPLSQFYSQRFTDKYWFEQRDESPQTKPVEIRSKRKIVGEFFSPVVVDVGRNLTWRVFLTQSILLTHTHVQTRNVSRHVKNVTVGTSARQQLAAALVHLFKLMIKTCFNSFLTFWASPAAATKCRFNCQPPRSSCWSRGLILCSSS